MNTLPFKNLTIEEMYNLLAVSGNGFPDWPSEEIQQGYTGTNKLATLRQAFHYLQLLEDDGAFINNWHGLDYACGWGRFASAMLKYGSAEQLDLVDAWPKTISIIKDLGYLNKITHVSELLKEGEIENDKYDFVLSFSLFTHLNKTSFEHNLKMLANCLNDGGRVYFTVRHDNFFDHKFNAMADEFREELKENNGFWFRGSGGDQTKEGHFGDTVVTKSFLNKIDKNNLIFRYLGSPNDLQKMYVMEKM